MEKMLFSLLEEWKKNDETGSWELIRIFRLHLQKTSRKIGWKKESGAAPFLHSIAILRQ